MSETSARIVVEVAYAVRGSADVTVCELAAGATAADAIASSRVCDRHPGLDAASMNIGVFGRLINLQDRVADGDRIELYRPLQADPKLARRQRVRVARRRGKPTVAR